ncbi:hypothetical protein RAMLITH_15135 [Ramlibacter sp. RBP-2]|uniref:Uncharacterized protein n=1 Tax=Ramlibacter lithotrophicus TaxID=2606681 RepID=A0A7X6DHA6_9BURK|nr:hypothetical protein [Ramlibacter lithotrophicus]NKE67157.1 hypothetical protein [Ramlibacter lithotrophicus]
MVSERQGGSRGGSAAAGRPRPVATRPGSVNRGFASVDPERQREPVAGGNAPDEHGKVPPSRGGRGPVGGAAAQPARARRARGEPDAGGEGGSG